MDTKNVQIPGVGIFGEGQKIVLRDSKDRIYRGHLQAAGTFISIWEDGYLHCVRFSDVTYIGTEMKGTVSERKPVETPQANGSRLVPSGEVTSKT